MKNATILTVLVRDSWANDNLECNDCNNNSEFVVNGTYEACSDHINNILKAANVSYYL